MKALRPLMLGLSALGAECDFFRSSHDADACSILFRSVAGDAQAGPNGQPLAVPLRVETRYQLPRCTERPAPGIDILWDIGSGGGVIVPASSTTDAQGFASAQWVLGTQVGSQTARARFAGAASVQSAPPPVVFTATAWPSPFRNLRIVSGDGARANTGQAVTAEVELVWRQIESSTDTPIPGNTIDWSIVSGGGSLAAATGTTNAQGRATMQWTLGPLTGQQLMNVTARTAAGTPTDSRDVLTATVRATADAIPVASVQVVGAASIVATVPNTYSTVLRDAFGNQLFDRVVLWKTTPSGRADVVAQGQFGTTAEVTGRKVPSMTLSAESEGIIGMMNVLITPGPVASIVVAPIAVTLAPGGTQAYAASAFDAEGNAVPNVTFSWASLTPAVASVNASTGVATALTPGTATIRATANGTTVNGNVQLSVSTARVAYARFDAASIAAGQANASYALNFPANGAISVTRASTGVYTVTFAGQATPAGGATNVVLSTFGTGNSDYCKLEEWHNQGGNLVATVRCFLLIVQSPVGPVDGQFTILLLGSSALGGRFAFAYFDPLVPGIAPDATFTSGSAPVSVATSGTGSYLVDFPGLARPQPNDAEVVMVTAAGAAPHRCAFGQDANGLTGQTAPIACHEGTFASLGIPAGSPFSTALISRGRPGMRAGLAANTLLESIYGTDTPFGASQAAYNSAGGAVTQTHQQMGRFTIRFAGLGGDVRLAVQVTSASLNGDYCKVAGWNSVAGQGGLEDLVVNVECYETDGTFEDQGFRLVVIQ